MINGNSVNFQFGKESTFGVAATPKVKLNISTESLNDVYNKTEEGLLTGGIAAGANETMEISTEGDFGTLAKPTSLGYLLKGVFGVETVSANADDDNLYDHVFTAIGNGENDFLPSWTITVDRKASVIAYVGSIFNTLDLSANAGERVNLTIGVLGLKAIAGSIDSALVDTGTTEKSFKFHQGKVIIAGSEFGDVTAIGFNYNNNADNSVQTLSTGLYHKQPQQGQRECTGTATVLYSTATEALRSNYWKEDTTFAMSMDFTDEDGNILKIEFPVAQITSMNQANASGADTMTQDIEFKAIDNPTNFIKVTLTNSVADPY